MIRDLNEKVEAKQNVSNGNFEPIPKGDYKVKVKEIKPWKGTTKDIYVNMVDEKGQFIKENNKIKKELHKNFTFYNANITLEVLEGEYKGRILFTSITTHPNAYFITENFLYAIDVPEITLNQVQDKCIGKELVVGVEIDEKAFKNVTDATTGATKQVPNPRNEVKSFKRPSLDETIAGL